MNDEELQTEITEIVGDAMFTKDASFGQTIKSLMELFRRSDGRAAEGPLDPLVVEPKRAQQMQREDNAHPRRAEPATSDPARCRPVARSAEALTDGDCIELYETCVEAEWRLCSREYSYPSRAACFNELLTQNGLYVSRNSDGERSEHRADNAEVSNPHPQKS